MFQSGLRVGISPSPIPFSLPSPPFPSPSPLPFFLLFSLPPPFLPYLPPSPPLPGSSVRQREVTTPHVVKLCVLIEGGPGAAFEAQQFSWNGNTVIPVGVTGGAAAGLFNVPQSIFQRPPVIDASDWSLLSNKEATPTQIADTIVRIIRTLIFTELGAGPRTPGMKQRKWVGFRSGIQRSETVPRQTTPTSSPTQPMKRTFSDSSKSPSSRAKLRATNSS